MKKEKDIRVEMTRVEDNVVALVKVDYMDKNAKEHTGLMMLDSGSNNNILSCTMAKHIGQLCHLEESEEILTITGDIVTLRTIRFSFALGGKYFHEVFCVNDNRLPQIDGDCPIIGILGINFMQQYGLAIDYSNFTFHTSDVRPDNLKVSDCDFFFPMEIGLKYYGLPIMRMGQGEKEIVAIADTGSTNNMIAEQSLSNNSFHCEYLDSMDIIRGLSNTVETKDAIVKFDLLSLRGTEESAIEYKDIFKVHSQYFIETDVDDCDEDGVQVPPVAALIGSPFMAKEGGVLDFGANIIYKRKVA